MTKKSLLYFVVGIALTSLMRVRFFQNDLYDFIVNVILLGFAISFFYKSIKEDVYPKDDNVTSKRTSVIVGTVLIAIVMGAVLQILISL